MSLFEELQAFNFFSRQSLAGRIMPMLFRVLVVEAAVMLY